MQSVPGRQVMIMAVLLIVMLVLSAGCGALDTLSTIKTRFNEEPATEETEISLDMEDSISYEFTSPSEETSLAGDVMEVTLYFADGYGQSLVSENRYIPKVEGIARATINELLAGPSMETGLLPAIPYGTTLRDINVKEDGLVIIDFSRDLIDNHVGGDLGESLTVYSIVNTLTQFPTVNRVQFLVDGQYVETIAGAIDLSRELYPDTSLVMGDTYYQ